MSLNQQVQTVFTILTGTITSEYQGKLPLYNGHSEKNEVIL